MLKKESIKIYSKNHIKDIARPVFMDYKGLDDTWILVNEQPKKPVNTSNQFLSSIHLYSVPSSSHKKLLSSTIPSLLNNSIFGRVLNTDFEAFCKSLTDITEENNRQRLLNSYQTHRLEESPIIRLKKNPLPKDNYFTITAIPISNKVLKVLSENPFVIYQASPATIDSILSGINEHLKYSELEEEISNQHPTTFLYGVEYDKYAYDTYIGIGIIHQISTNIIATVSIFSKPAKDFIQNNTCNHIIALQNVLFK